MSVKFTVVDKQIRQLKSALQALAKLGTSHELMLEAMPEKLILRSINSSRSGYMAITLHNQFFEAYNVFDQEVVQAGLLTKHVLSVFRSQRVSKMLVDVTPNNGYAVVTLHCENGMMKQYSLVMQDIEILQATIDRHTLPNAVVARAQNLNRILQSFSTQLEEVTLASMPQVSNNEDMAGKAVQLHSFNSDTSRGGNDALDTQLAMDDYDDIFTSYTHASSEPADVTFNLKDFRTMVGLCETLELDVSVRFDSPGAPLLVEPHAVHADMSGLEAELVLATLLDSQMDKIKQKAINKQQQAERHRGMSTGRLTTLPRSRLNGNDGHGLQNNADTPGNVGNTPAEGAAAVMNGSRSESPWLHAVPQFVPSRPSLRSRFAAAAADSPAVAAADATDADTPGAVAPQWQPDAADGCNMASVPDVVGAQNAAKGTPALQVGGGLTDARTGDAATYSNDSRFALPTGGSGAGGTGGAAAPQGTGGPGRPGYNMNATAVGNCAVDAMLPFGLQTRAAPAAFPDSGACGAIQSDDAHAEDDFDEELPPSPERGARRQSAEYRPGMMMDDEEDM